MAAKPIAGDTTGELVLYARDFVFVGEVWSLEARRETSNRNPHFGLAGGKAQIKLVEPIGIEPTTS